MTFFKHQHRPISFFVWPMCSRRDFYFDGAQSALIIPLVRCRHLTVLSNTDRSLSNNQIELLNKVIKMYTKSIITIAFILLVIERQIL